MLYAQPEHENSVSAVLMKGTTDETLAFFNVGMTAAFKVALYNSSHDYFLPNYSGVGDHDARSDFRLLIAGFLAGARKFSPLKIAFEGLRPFEKSVERGFSAFHRRNSSIRSTLAWRPIDSPLSQLRITSL
jgi:hypothetical protein